MKHKIRDRALKLQLRVISISQSWSVGNELGGRGWWRHLFDDNIVQSLESLSFSPFPPFFRCDSVAPIQLTAVVYLHETMKIHPNPPHQTVSQHFVGQGAEKGDEIGEGCTRS